MIVLTKIINSMTAYKERIKMSSWNIIKNYFIKKEEIGNIGYFNQLNKAAELTIELINNLTDSNETRIDINKDEGLKDALLMRQKIKNILGE